MWGTKAFVSNSKKVTAAGTMKWHLVDEECLEERIVAVGWRTPKDRVKVMYGHLMCGGKREPESFSHTYYDGTVYVWPNYKLPLVLKESIKLSNSRVCVYCKKFKMKEMGIEDQIIA